MTHHNIGMAKKTIAGFVSLILGQNTKIAWGDRPAVDTNGIMFLPTPKVGDCDEIALLTRLAVHEAGHKLHTDPACFDRLDKEQLTFFNWLEDPRIEMELSKQYPGAILILSRGISKLVERAFQNTDSETPEGKKRLLPLGVVIKGMQASAPKTALNPFMDGLEAQLQEAFSPAQNEAINNAVSQITSLKNSYECELLAKELLIAFTQADQEPNDASSNDSQDGGAAESESRPAASDAAQTATDNAEEGDLGAMLRSAIQSLYPKASDSGKEAVAEHDDSGDDITHLDDEAIVRLADLAKEEGADIGELLQKAIDAIVEQPEDDQPSSDWDGAGAGGGLSVGTAPLLSESRLGHVQSRLVHVLLRELQDKRKKPSRNARAGQSVNPQRFWRLQSIGDTKVFRTRGSVTGIDCGVTILLDRSGSMHKILATAAHVALAFSMAMQRIGNVRTAVSVFPWDGTYTHALQNFGESPRLVASRCESLTAAGGTPVAQAILTELPLLLAQRKNKNLMIVITDDGPDSPDLLHAAIKEAARHGVDIYAVGIGCHVGSYYSASTTVSTVEDLPHAMEQLFSEHIACRMAA